MKKLKWRFKIDRVMPPNIGILPIYWAQKHVECWRRQHVHYTLYNIICPIYNIRYTLYNKLLIIVFEPPHRWEVEIVFN